MLATGCRGATTAANDFAPDQALGTPEGAPPNPPGRGAVALTDGLVDEVVDDVRVVMTDDVDEVICGDFVPV